MTVPVTLGRFAAEEFLRCRQCGGNAFLCGCKIISTLSPQALSILEKPAKGMENFYLLDTYCTMKTHPNVICQKCHGVVLKNCSCAALAIKWCKCEHPTMPAEYEKKAS